MSRRQQNRSSSGDGVVSSPTKGADAALAGAINKLRLTSSVADNVVQLQDESLFMRLLATSSVVPYPRHADRAESPVKQLPPLEGVSQESFSLTDLKDRLQVIDEFLQHDKPTPIGKRYLTQLRNLYKETIAQYPANSATWERLVDKTRDVELYEGRMSRLQAEGRNLQQLLVERKQMELQMRYGDYLSDLTDTLTTKAAAHIRGKQKQWTDVADELEREEHEGNTEWLDYSEMNPLLQIGSRLQYCIHVRKPLHSKISQACTILDWHVETTVCAIKQYGERNKLVHASVNKMLEQNQWQAFGNRCTDDLNAILGIFDPDDPRVPMYTSFVTRVRDAWVTKPHPRGDWEPLEHIRTARDGKGDIPGLTRFKDLKQVAELPKNKRAGEALLKIIHDIGKGKFKSKEERDRRIDKSKNVNAIKKELKDALNSFDMAVERIASLGEEQKALLGDRDALRVQKEHLEGRLQVLELQRESEKVVGEPSSPKDDRKSAVATASEQGVLSQMFKSVNDGIKMRL